jgi:hypothetical protein
MLAAQRGIWPPHLWYISSAASGSQVEAAR